MSLSQDSVSAHSFLAISNFECISARLCGYCASEMFAKTLDEDFLIWKTILESILYSLHSFATLTANSSLYSKSILRFTAHTSDLNQTIGLYGIRNTLRYGISHLARMESMQRASLLYGIKNEGKGMHAVRDAIRLMGNSIQFALRIDAIHKPFGLE